MKTSIALFVLGTSLALAGCDDGSDEPATRTRAAEVSSAAAAVDTDWRDAASARAEDVRRTAPDAYDLARAIEPRPTRAGFLRFSTSAIHDPAVGAVFLDRLASGTEPPEVRAALVEALPRTGVEYLAPLSALMTEDSDPVVRTAIVAAMRRAEGGDAVSVLRLGLEDRDAAVRAEASRVAGTRDDAAILTAELTAVLGDADPRVRAAAARSIGLLGSSDAADAMADLLDDDDAEVRLQALRGLERIDPARASAAAAKLTTDQDPAVRAAASRVVAR